MTMLKFSPFTDSESGLRQFQDTFNRLLEPGARPWTPAVDIFETENDLLLKMDVPEVDLQDIDIRLENDTLTISGDRKWQSQPSSQGYHRIERSYGSFARTFTLPNTVDFERVKAENKNGVLVVTLPKKDVAKPRSIKVEINHN